MRRRTILCLASAMLLTGAALAATGAAGADPGNGNGAFITNNFGCGLFNGNGGFAFTDSSHSVRSVSNSVTKCSATVTPSATGHAVTYSGFLCGVELYNGVFVATTDSRETVSASGQATLTCKAGDS